MKINFTASYQDVVSLSGTLSYGSSVKISGTFNYGSLLTMIATSSSSSFSLISAMVGSTTKFSVSGDGAVYAAGGATIGGNLVIGGNIDPNGMSPCTVGQIAWSETYLYVCVRSTVNDQWKRVLLSDY